MSGTDKSGNGWKATILTLVALLTLGTPLVTMSVWLYGIKRDVSDLRQQSQHNWTITDHHEFARQLRERNPTIHVPETAEVLREVGALVNQRRRGTDLN